MKIEYPISVMLAVEIVPLALVVSHVHADSLERPDGVLHQRRGVHETQYAVAEGESVHHLRPALVVGVHGNVADAFSGKGQVLGVGVDDDGRFIVGKYLGVSESVIDDSACRVHRL